MRCASMHFLNRGCLGCDAYTLRRSSLDTVDAMYRDGRIGQDWFEAYMHVWATSVHRYSSNGAGWSESPTETAVIERATALREEMEAVRT